VNLDVHALLVNHVQYQVARPWRVEGDIPMTGPVGPVRRRLGVEALAEVVFACAPLDDAKVVQESGQGWLIGRLQRRINLGSQDRPLFSQGQVVGDITRAVARVTSPSVASIRSSTE
jgi:hypothetical protein